jgi:hypothetical protein
VKRASSNATASSNCREANMYISVGLLVLILLVVLLVVALRGRGRAV